jgi:predicted AlkP superfamily phosphohydrolase/phosphomutase/Flp pilus assembly protein TadD
MRRAVVRWVLLVALAAGCADPRERLIVLGLDGMDPETVDTLMVEGKMPSFARLRQDGAYGRLRSQRPILSPIIWTTIATGKPPEQHGIGHFVAVNAKSGEQLPVTSRMRRVKALWNVFSGAGRTVGVVGWWATWPAEAVNGVVVSDHTCYHFLFPDAARGARLDVGVVHPPELAEKLAPLVKRPDDVGASELARFAHVTAEDLARPFRFDDELSHLRWALATAETYRRIGLRVWSDSRPDLLMVYIEATDSTAHLFGHLFRAGAMAGELGTQQRRFGDTVEQVYRYADEIVGEYLAAMDAGTTLVVLSDHGFELGALPDDPTTTRDMRRVTERYHRLDGILYLYGARVRRARLDRPGLLDVAPTLLALAGIAPAADMPGRVLSEALRVSDPPRSVPTYEDATTAAAPAVDAGDAGVDPVIVERLRALGYLDTTSPKADRTLAARHFEAGRYADAAEAYRRLLEVTPTDAGLHASLAGALGALGRDEEALAEATEAIRLGPLEAEGYVNRALLLERRGDRDGAVRDYRAAAQCNPGYEPARRALARLTGSPLPDPPGTDAERLASRIADKASTAARHGDYDGAGKLLDDAMRIAPDYALLHQYRANIAFLKGDRAGAIAALERAVALAPGNVLYRSNLERLRALPEGRTSPPGE